MKLEIFQGSNKDFQRTLCVKAGVILAYLITEAEGRLHEQKGGSFQCYEHTLNDLMALLLMLQIQMGFYVFHQAEVNLFY